MWAVVTVPRREQMADAIIAQLREPVLKFVDTTGDIQANHILAWTRLCEFESPWVGVIQDDVILAPDFNLQAQSRIDEADALGYRALSFYNHSHTDAYLETVSDRWKRVDLTRIPGIQRASAGDMRIKSALPGEQCVLMRREIALQYQQFAHDNAELYRVFPDVHDGLLGLFLNKIIGQYEDIHAIPMSHVYIAVPHLLDHRIDVPSCFPTHNALRSSSSFSVRYHGNSSKCPSTKPSSLQSYKA